MTVEIDVSQLDTKIRREIYDDGFARRSVAVNFPTARAKGEAGIDRRK